MSVIILGYRVKKLLAGAPGRARHGIKHRLARLVCALTIVLLSACDERGNGKLGVGDLFPLDSLAELALQSDRNLDLKAKTLVVNFWATWCTPCRKEMPELQRLSDSMDKSRFSVIGVSVDEDKNLVREFLLQQEIHFANYLDTEQRLAKDLLDIRAFPETFIISPGGIIIRRIVGEQLWDSKAVHVLLESIHHGKAPIPDSITG